MVSHFRLLVVTCTISELFPRHQDSQLDRRSISALGVNKVSTNQNIILAGVAFSDSEATKKGLVQATVEAECDGVAGVANEEAHSSDSLETGRHSEGEEENNRSKSKVSSSHGMRTRNSIKSGSVEEEADKTVEMGLALGFEFSEVEDVVLEEIMRREKEDIARFEAISV
ncbi:hypothetical protein Q3G72_024271 [Acer saccharum]|nr:hypothetical protein Q3G72_024271 [Acer saccharum]